MDRSLRQGKGMAESGRCLRRYRAFLYHVGNGCLLSSGGHVATARFAAFEFRGCLTLHTVQWISPWIGN
jgi:hypothetical protein